MLKIVDLQEKRTKKSKKTKNLDSKIESLQKQISKIQLKIDLLGLPLEEAEKQITVIIDRDPPVITVEAPQDGFITTSEVIEITGTVEDAHQVISVFVDNQPAAFVLNEFVLAPGENLISISATDQYDNTSTYPDISVTYIDDQDEDGLSGAEEDEYGQDPTLPEQIVIA